MARPRVAILGLGIMGSGMAGRLLSAGFPLTVYNRNREKASPFEARGAAVGDTPREAVRVAEVVISMVADDGASRSVWLGEDGALAGVSPGAVLIESSTLSVGWILELAELAKGRSCQFLDAPVTGSKPHAASGELLFLVGGPALALETVQPVLAVMSREVVHLGPNGSGARLKLINNFLCGVQAASFAEAASMVGSSGLDIHKALPILTAGAPGSPLVKLIYARVAAGDPTTNFLLRLMAKDLTYAIGEAAQSGLTLETGKAALAVFDQAIARGRGDQDLSAIVAL